MISIKNMITELIIFALLVIFIYYIINEIQVEPLQPKPLPKPKTKSLNKERLKYNKLKNAVNSESLLNGKRLNKIIKQIRKLQYPDDHMLFWFMRDFIRYHSLNYKGNSSTSIITWAAEFDYGHIKYIIDGSLKHPCKTIIHQKPKHKSDSDSEQDSDQGQEQIQEPNRYCDHDSDPIQDLKNLRHSFKEQDKYLSSEIQSNHNTVLRNMYNDIASRSKFIYR